MKHVFIIKNQNDHYLDKHDDWADGSEPKKLFKTLHRDIALNKLIDANIKDFELRAEVLRTEATDKDIPQIEVLNPIPKEAAKEESLFETDEESEQDREEEDSSELVDVEIIELSDDEAALEQPEEADSSS